MLSSNVARAYVMLAQAFSAHDVAVADHERADKLLQLGRQRVAAGLDNQLQIRQAESALASAEQQIMSGDTTRVRLLVVGIVRDTRQAPTDVQTADIYVPLAQAATMLGILGDGVRR